MEPGFPGGQCAFKPHRGNIHCGVQAVFFALFDDAVPGFDRGIGQLELDRDLGGHVQIALFRALEDLHHDDVLVREAAVINDVVFPLERMTLILQCCQKEHLQFCNQNVTQ